MKRITILGSTGSIGKSTLDLLADHTDKFETYALTAKSSCELLFAQCLKFNPYYAVIEKEIAAQTLQKRGRAAGLRTIFLYGQEALQQVAALPEVDYVMAAIVGAAGLLPTLAAARAGKRILLANKEALVMSGALFMETVKKSGAILLPVDSEHNAIYQCMPPGYMTGESPIGVEKIILTASGGPFRTLPLHLLEQVTPQQAITHPNWSMGAKISVDSATMMNKGFELIEAYWLFSMDIADIEVMIHPQSIIHSMVHYEDGSFLAQLGSPDMKTPISYTLSWPQRMTTSVKKLDLVKVGTLTFQEVDYQRFPSMKLAYAAVKAGGTASTLLNAANEVAVAAFLENQLAFSVIPFISEEVLNRIPVEPAVSIESILEADRQARIMGKDLIAKSSLISH